MKTLIALILFSSACFGQFSGEQTSALKRLANKEITRQARVDSLKTVVSSLQVEKVIVQTQQDSIKAWLGVFQTAHTTFVIEGNSRIESMDSAYVTEMQAAEAVLRTKGERLTMINQTVDTLKLEINR